MQLDVQRSGQFAAALPAVPLRPRGQAHGLSPAREDAGAPLVALNPQRPFSLPYIQSQTTLETSAAPVVRSPHVHATRARRCLTRPPDSARRSKISTLPLRFYPPPIDILPEPQDTPVEILPEAIWRKKTKIQKAPESTCFKARSTC